jgi:hypothetical protein
MANSRRLSLRGIASDEFDLRNNLVKRTEDGRLISTCAVTGERVGKQLDQHLVNLRRARENSLAQHDIALQRDAVRGTKSYDDRHLDEFDRLSIQLQYEEADRRYQRAERNLSLAPTGSALREEYALDAKRHDEERLHAQLRLVQHDRVVDNRFAEQADLREREYSEELQRRKQEANERAAEKSQEINRQLSVAAQKRDKAPTALDVWAKRQESSRSNEPAQERAAAPAPKEIRGYAHTVGRDHVAYTKSATLEVAFRDYGKRLALEKSSDSQDRRAALLLAAERFQGNIGCRGSEEHKRATAAMAVELGLGERFSGKEMRSYIKEFEAARSDERTHDERPHAHAEARSSEVEMGSEKVRDVGQSQATGRDKRVSPEQATGTSIRPRALEQEEKGAALGVALSPESGELSRRAPAGRDVAESVEPDSGHEPRRQPGRPTALERDVAPVRDLDRGDTAWGYGADPIRAEPKLDETSWVRPERGAAWGYDSVRAPEPLQVQTTGAVLPLSQSAPELPKAALEERPKQRESELGEGDARSAVSLDDGCRPQASHQVEPTDAMSSREQTPSVGEQPELEATPTVQTAPQQERDDEEDHWAAYASQLEASNTAGLDAENHQHELEREYNR